MVGVISIQEFSGDFKCKYLLAGQFLRPFAITESKNNCYFLGLVNSPYQILAFSRCGLFVSFWFVAMST